jgi:hypothetical protein
MYHESAQDGVSVLALTGSMLNYRSNGSLTPRSNIRTSLLRFLHFPLITAVVLCIVGGVGLTSTNVNQINLGKKLIKAGIIVFLLTFVYMVILALLILRSARKHQTPDRRLLHAVLLALPLLSIRFIYSLIADFGNTKEFSLVSGSPVAQFFMATLMEWIITIMYIFAGFWTLRLRVSGYPGRRSKVEAQFGTEEH